MDKTISSLLDKALKEIVKGIIKRPLFPPNVNIVTIAELYGAVNRYVSALEEEKKKVEITKEEINSLRKVESSLLDGIKEMECLSVFYENFWEEKVLDFLKVKKEEIVIEYDQEIMNLENEEGFLNDFTTIEKKSRMIKLKVDDLSKRSQKLMKQYEESLIDNIKTYFKQEMAFIERFRNSVFPKLQKTDKLRVQRLLDDLENLYGGISEWVESVLLEISSKKILPSNINQINRTLIFERAQKIREELIKEIKDLDELETLILMELIKILSRRRATWLALAEVCELVAKNVAQNVDKVKGILLGLSEKGFLTLSIGL